MSIISCIWIIVAHYSFWRRLSTPVYIELDNLAEGKEDLGDQQQIWKRVWRGAVTGAGIPPKGIS